MEIKCATINHLDLIVKIDTNLIGNSSRKSWIHSFVKQGKCFILCEKEKICGYLLYDEDFFGHPFIELLVIEQGSRRKGYGSALMTYIVTFLNTEKVFSSTNASNIPMQRLFEHCGWIVSGSIDHLDYNDPELIYVYLRKEKVNNEL